MVQRDNYAIAAVRERDRFLRYDQEASRRAFSLPADGSYLYIRVVDCWHRIDRRSGAVEWRGAGGQWEPAGFQAVMTIYDALCCGGTPPALTGDYAPAGSLGCAVLSAGQGGDLFAAAGQRLLRRFSDLPAALARLGGTPAGTRADLAWVLPVFAFLPVQLRFWRADEEFPAQLQFFGDRSTPRLLHYETLFYAAGYIVRRIEAALPDESSYTGGPSAAER